ncbi:MAG: hypothetical protein ABJE95_24840 [Byssovorax sp.]
MASDRDKSSDYEIQENTLDIGVDIALDPSAEIDAVLGDLEALLKNGDIMSNLSERGINTSLALVAAGALRSYLAGKKADAAEDFATVAEEIQARLAVARGPNGHGAS